MRPRKRQARDESGYADVRTIIDDAGAAEDPAEPPEDEVYDIFRVRCPECARPIALLADEDVLPEHALCATPWDPFGLTVCAGSGRSAEDAEPVGDAELAERDMTALLTLPAGLDWRTQPFSHAGAAVSRPVRPTRPVRAPRAGARSVSR